MAAASSPSFRDRIAFEGNEAQMWTFMYQGALLVGGLTAVVIAGWRILASKREHARLQALVVSRTEQLRQSEELFRSIFEHASEGIFQSSLDGRNLRANPAMARICGYASPQEMREELTDVATLFYVQPDRRAEIIEKIAREGAVVGCDSEIRRKGGGSIWIAESVRAVTDPLTGDTIYQGSIVDITARREMHEAQEQARTAAEAANRAKSAFLARMTHELRTPLTGILGSARVALRDDTTNVKSRERFALITQSGEHLLRLIDEVLDHSRIEAGRMELRSDPFDLAEFLRGVVNVFELRAAETRLSFRCEADPILPLFVSGDAVRLRQVLDNLLCNAFKFTDRGEVVLRVERNADRRSAHFEVEDTGIGIPADDLEAIFQPFQQALAPGRAAPPGVGLGLNICARLVELMGGELRVESTPAMGSRFFFEIPLPDADHGATIRHSQAEEAGTSSAPAPAEQSALIVPPDETVDELLALSMTGDIVRLRQRLAELSHSEANYAEFTRELERLAAGFRMEAIGAFLREIKGLREPAANPSGGAGS